MLLDQSARLKAQSHQPVYIPELRKLVVAAFSSNNETMIEPDKNLSFEKSKEQQYKKESQIKLMMKLEKLLQRLTTIVDGDPNLWDVYAVFYSCANQKENAKSCRVKQVI